MVVKYVGLLLFDGEADVHAVVGVDEVGYGLQCAVARQRGYLLDQFDEFLSVESKADFGALLLREGGDAAGGYLAERFDVELESAVAERSHCAADAEARGFGYEGGVAAKGEGHVVKAGFGVVGLQFVDYRCRGSHSAGVLQQVVATEGDSRLAVFPVAYQVGIFHVGGSDGVDDTADDVGSAGVVARCGAFEKFVEVESR